jgi:lipopolysaccharide transport system permease protein
LSTDRIGEVLQGCGASKLRWTVILLPVGLIPVLAACLEVSWFLSSLGVYVRVTGQVMGVITSALRFLSPIFFPSSAVSEDVRLLIKLNPLFFPIEQAREVLMWGRPPSWDGLFVFQRTRRGLADVM